LPTYETRADKPKILQISKIRGARAQILDGGVPWGFIRLGEARDWENLRFRRIRARMLVELGSGWAHVV
jgi:hypothetical protein